MTSVTKKTVKTNRKANPQEKNTKKAHIKKSRTERILLFRSGRQIGSLILGLEFPVDASSEDQIYAYSTLANMLAKCRQIEEDVHISDQLTKRKGWGLNIAMTFIYFQCLLKEESNLSDPLLIQEKANEAVFLDMIKEHGVKAFRNFEVNQRIDSWLKDKKNAGNSINRVARALMDSAGVSTLPLKPGKPEAKIVLAIGASRIRSLYEDLREVLVLVKQDAEGYGQTGSDPLELLPKYWDEYYRSLHEKYKLNPKDNAKCYRKIFKTEPPYDLPAMMLFDLLREDVPLLDEYWDLHWVPSEMARTLLGKLLGVSSSKVISVLFR